MMAATNVVKFWGHHWYHCPEPCTDAPCYFCDGGLAWCTVCGGAEVELPMHCPGRKMSAFEKDAVSAGKLDYDGRRGGIKGPAFCEEVEEQ